MMSETNPFSSLVDPSGKPLAETVRIVAPKHVRDGDRIVASPGKSRIVRPSPQKELSGDLREQFTVDNAGRLYVASSKHGYEITSDIGAAPAEIRESRVAEYYDFSEDQVKRVLDAHATYSKNLFSGSPRQRGVYLAKIAEAAGYDRSNTHVVGIAHLLEKAGESLSVEYAERAAGKMSYAREEFLASACVDQYKQRVASEDELIPLKESYRSLALLLMPDVWSSLRSEERRWIVDSLLLLYEVEEKPEEIRSPELFLRLADIAKTEPDVGIRSLIYLFMDTVPYLSLPREAKETIAKVITQQKEFQAPIATSLLLEGADTKGGVGRETQRLQQEYQAFRKDVLKRLSADVAELAGMSFVEWNQLVRDIQHLNLLSITDDPAKKHRLSQETFGIELERSPFVSLIDVSASHEVDRLQPVVDVQPLYGLRSASRDLSCVEVRTVGAIPMTSSAFQDIHTSLRAIEHVVPGALESMHVHVEFEKAESIQTFIGPARVNDGDSGVVTFEVRCFRPPSVMIEEEKMRRPRSYRGDILFIERAVLFGALSTGVDVFQIQPDVMNVEGFPKKNGIQKILALSLCGSDPIQRAAVIQLLHQPPLFLDNKFMISQLGRLTPESLKMEYLLDAKNLVYKEMHHDYSQYMELYEYVQEAERNSVRSIISLFEDEEGKPCPETRINGLYWSKMSKIMNEDVWRMLPKHIQIDCLDRIIEHSYAPFEQIVVKYAKLLPPERISSALEVILSYGSSYQALEKLSIFTHTWYAQIRERLTPEDRSLLVHLLVRIAPTDERMGVLLKQDLAEGDDETLAILRLRFCDVSAEPTEEVKQAIAYGAVHRIDFRDGSDIASYVAGLNVPYAVEYVLRNFPGDNQIHYVGEDLGILEAAMQNHANFDQIFDSSDVLDEETRQRIFDHLVQRGDMGESELLDQFVLRHFSDLKPNQRKKLYFMLGVERSPSSSVISYFQECVRLETDQNLFRAALHYVGPWIPASRYPEDWYPFMQECFSKVDDTAKQEVLIVLMQTGDEDMQNFVLEHFPYKLPWSDAMMEQMAESIYRVMGAKGQEFLMNVYDHQPPLALKRTIERLMPRVLDQVKKQRSARRNRRDGSIGESLSA